MSAGSGRDCLAWIGLQKFDGGIAVFSGQAFAIEVSPDEIGAFLAKPVVRINPARGPTGSDLPRIIRPVEQCLPLPGAAGQIAGAAVSLELGNVPPDGSPSFDLSFVVGAAPSHEVAAVPLEPAARVLMIDPAFRPPDR